MMLREFSAGLALPFVWLGRAIASVYVNYMALVGLLPRFLQNTIHSSVFVGLGLWIAKLLFGGP
jgi:hypothetical protein